ncbi:MAG: MerR family transcriptional regulator [Anaerolineae bacterium]|nr:MAG: MerR family transcriptional regulator [Anaerolineae bacterium]
MLTSRQTPSYNLKAVVQQTGLKPDTLRAWERRYGLPQPQRSEGGHRLYSARDVETIKWLIARQREGLTIRRAVVLWRRLEAEGQDPLHAATSSAAQASSAPLLRTAGDILAKLRQDWIAACLAFDEQGAENILTQAFALYPPETVCLELLQRGVAHIGDGWYHGQTTVQQEHFATALAMRRLEALIMAAPAPTRPGRILVACPPQENHALSPLLLTFLLRRRGWDVLYLGASVPLDRMKTTVSTARPKLVILAAQQLHTAATLLAMAQLLQQEGVPLAFGGRIFNVLPALRRRIPGHFLGQSLEDGPAAIEQLMASPRPYAPLEAAPLVYPQALEHYCERQAHMQAHLGQALERTGIDPEHLAIANAETSRNIIAALTLGDMAFLGVEIEWIKGLLDNHRLPREPLDNYLQAYYEAAQNHLDERGQPIARWLGQLFKENA